MLTLFNILLVGVLYGTTSVAVGHPFDTIKTKMQAQHGFENEGMIRSFAKTVRSQGIKGLYRLVITLFLCFKRLNREVQKEVTFIPFRFKTHLTAFFHLHTRRLYSTLVRTSSFLVTRMCIVHMLIHRSKIRTNNKSIQVIQI